jgi:Cof subfamily protein (haloacid dehalogenase superfamily)
VTDAQILSRAAGIKLLCCDVDDTLMNGSKQIPPEVSSAIARFQKKGGLFTIASGRGLRGLEPCFPFVTPDVPVICFNGGGLYDERAKRFIEITPLDPEARRAVGGVLKYFPGVCAEIYTQSGAVFDNVNGTALRHMLHEKLPDIRSPFDEVPDPWLKVVFACPPGNIAALRGYLLGAYGGGKRFRLVQSAPCYYEILPAGASKGAMLRRLAQLEGIPMENIAAAGDADNDAEMIKYAGIGAAMGNAVESLRAVADIVLPDSESGGVAKLASLLCGEK